jgi:hypothetical protein
MQLYFNSPVHLHCLKSNNFAFTVLIYGSAGLLLSPLSSCVCHFVITDCRKLKTILDILLSTCYVLFNANRCQTEIVIFRSVKLKNKCSFIVTPYKLTCLDHVGFSQTENSKFNAFIGSINYNKSKFYA